MEGKFLSDEEAARAEKFTEECLDKAKQVQALFTSDFRGMMQFVYVMYIFHSVYTQLLNKDEATEKIADWLAAGEPNTPDDMMKKILEEFKGRVN